MLKTQYELYLRTWNRHNPNAEQDKDYETIEFLPCENYKDAITQAKQLSKRLPIIRPHAGDIVQVQIAAYYSGDEAEEEYGTTYYLLWKETYENGKGCGRY